MTTPKFSNTTKKLDTNRRGLKSSQKEETISDKENKQSGNSLKEYMQEKISKNSSEATRPITLRFEESLWNRVEELRGSLSKNDFFKELVKFYDSHA